VKKFLFSVFTLFSVAIIFAQQEDHVYIVGYPGPAGGLVFYDKGTYSDGWRYMEAAPANTEWANYIEEDEWGSYAWNDDVIDIGSGRQKTNEILLMMTDIEFGKYVSGRAALLCRTLTVNGYDDWFLPSIEELNLMYVNLKQRGIGRFSPAWYWSSTGNGKAAGYPLIQNFSDGSVVYGWFGVFVRAVRIF
jgi:hypothetical protein